MMTAGDCSSRPRRLTVPPRMRLMHSRQFEALRRGGVRAHAGPLSVAALPNGLPHLRFGLSVAARVGTAVKRARVKRLLRESVRLMQHELSGGYDLLISVRPHATLPLVEYQRHLATAMQTIDRTCPKKSSSTTPGANTA